ncbi:hypothetical protein FJZ31_34400 [Candidatus Poribacteria bacterium]|nr:hypothetical protein [Candidatus Poribacteria bacterium]
MSQIIIIGEPRFEDVKILVDMLPESDRLALRNYLLELYDGTSKEEFSALLSRFRSHSRSDEEIEQDVRNAIEEVRNAKKSSNL